MIADLVLNVASLKLWQEVKQTKVNKMNELKTEDAVSLSPIIIKLFLIEFQLFLAYAEKNFNTNIKMMVSTA